MTEFPHNQFPDIDPALEAKWVDESIRQEAIVEAMLANTPSPEDIFGTVSLEMFCSQCEQRLKVMKDFNSSRLRKSLKYTTSACAHCCDCAQRVN